MVEDPVELGEQRAQPDGPLRHLHPEHRLDTEHDPELVGERRQPVVPVREDGDLPVVADLEELLGPAVHVADDRLGGDDALAVEDDLEPEHPVRRRVLRTDVEDHVRRGQPAGPDRDVEGPRRVRLGGGVGAHAASLPHAPRRHPARTRASTQRKPPSPAGSVSAVSAEVRASAVR